MNLYFETSAVNHLFKMFSHSDGPSSIKTRELQLSRGLKWQISAVTLWELFQTKDVNLRYELFDFARFLFIDELFPSPEEIVVNYINRGCPRIERKYPLKSCSLFSQHWSLACSNPGFEFYPDSLQVKNRTKHLQYISKYLVKYKKGYEIQSFDKLDNVSSAIDGSFLKYIWNELVALFGMSITDDDKQYIGISVQITMMLLCYGISFDLKTIELFWEEKGKLQPLERLEFALKSFPEVFFRGPISNISKMIFSQSKGKWNRGVYFDSLHSIYITYSDLYFTADSHFLQLSREVNDPNMKKVTDVRVIDF